MPSNKRHTDREYEAELRQVRENLLKMAGRVEQMIGDATQALLDGDQALAKRTVDADIAVNRLEMETDELCLIILAKRQPLASDLRFITLAMKMVTDLERIGDLAVNIAERALTLDGTSPGSHGPSLGRMAEVDAALLREAIDAFVGGDAERAERLPERDKEVDDLYWHTVMELQRAMLADLSMVERGMHLTAVAKFLERIGDHITNLAELAVFMVRGKDIRHPGTRAAGEPPKE